MLSLTVERWHPDRHHCAEKASKAQSGQGRQNHEAVCHSWPETLKTVRKRLFYQSKQKALWGLGWGWCGRNGTLRGKHKIMQTQEALRKKNKKKPDHYIVNLNEWEDSSAMNRNPGEKMSLWSQGDTQGRSTKTLERRGWAFGKRTGPRFSSQSKFQV